MIFFSVLCIKIIQPPSLLTFFTPLLKLTVSSLSLTFIFPLYFFSVPLFESSSSNNQYSFVQLLRRCLTRFCLEKMNHCAIQQSFAACEEMMMRSYSSISDKKDAVVCPKPRRLAGGPMRPLRCHQQDFCDSRSGADLLDIILTKGGGGVDQPAAQVASSPPFFCGSPPSRVSNPLIQDARFGDEKVTPVSPRAIPIPSGLTSSPSSSARKGGCVSRANFGHNPAVRVEGFDCLDRDRRNCSIPALA